MLAVVHGPHEVERRGDALHDRAVLECTLHHAPFAGFDRKRRRATDRGSLEMALAVCAWGWKIGCFESSPLPPPPLWVSVCLSVYLSACLSACLCVCICSHIP